MISALPNLPNAALKSGLLSLEWSFSVNTRSMLGLSPNGSRQCADTYASFASLPLPLKTPVTDGFTFAAGPYFFAVDAGSSSLDLTSAALNRTSNPFGISALGSTAAVALPTTCPSWSLSSPVPSLLPPTVVPPPSALQCFNSPVFLKTSLRNGCGNSPNPPSFSAASAFFNFSLETG